MVNVLLQFHGKCYVITVSVTFRVRTGPGKPGKSWNLIIWIPGLESHGILAKSWKVMEFHVGKFVCSRAAYNCSGLSDMYAGKNIKLRQ